MKKLYLRSEVKVLTNMVPAHLRYYAPIGLVTRIFSFCIEVQIYGFCAQPALGIALVRI